MNSLEKKYDFYTYCKGIVSGAIYNDESDYEYLFTVVPIWYENEFGTNYLVKRLTLFERLNISRKLFLKLETSSLFRKNAILLTRSAIDELGLNPKTSLNEAVKKFIYVMH